LKTIQDQKDILGEAGVLTKTAETLYENLKISEYETWPFLLYQNNITSGWNYSWHGQEGRSKVAAAAVALALIGSAAFAGYKAWTPENRARYYVWRLEKSNNTDKDRFRAGRELMSCLQGTHKAYSHLALILRDDGVPIKTAENVLSLMVESRGIASTQEEKLPNLLADALRNANPDVRSRVHSVLLYLADEKKIEVEQLLKEWKPSAKDSATDVEGMIKRWQAVNLQ
jgi:hypothetical protein